MLLALGKSVPILGDIIRSVESGLSYPSQYDPPPTPRKRYNPNYQQFSDQSDSDHMPQF